MTPNMGAMKTLFNHKVSPKSIGQKETTGRRSPKEATINNMVSGECDNRYNVGHSKSKDCSKIHITPSQYPMSRRNQPHEGNAVLDEKAH